MPARPSQARRPSTSIGQRLDEFIAVARKKSKELKKEGLRPTQQDVDIATGFSGGGIIKAIRGLSGIRLRMPGSKRTGGLPEDVSRFPARDIKQPPGNLNRQMNITELGLEPNIGGQRPSEKLLKHFALRRQAKAGERKLKEAPSSKERASRVTAEEATQRAQDLRQKSEIDLLLRQKSERAATKRKDIRKQEFKDRSEALTRVSELSSKEKIRFNELRELLQERITRLAGSFGRKIETEDILRILDDVKPPTKGK